MLKTEKKFLLLKNFKKKKPSLDLIEKYSKRFKISKSAILLFSEELNNDRNPIFMVQLNKKLRGLHE